MSHVSISAPPLSFLDSTPLLGDADVLRLRAEGEGYLFFRGLLPAEDVLQVRADALAVVERYGWLKAGQGMHGSLVNADALSQVPESDMRLDVGVSHAAYDDVQKLESIHRLPHHPHLLALYRTLFGGAVLAHPRHIARLVTPHPAMVPTPQHQDFPLVQGTPQTWTCWLPLGDCPRTLGGLTVLRASHRAGCLPIQPTAGAGNLAALLCPGEDQWVEGDYAAGDVLTFPSLTVHKALPCRQKEQMRLSLDVRYQPADEVVESRSLLPHCALPWEEIYADWTQDDLKYYWRAFPLALSAWDDLLTQPGRRIC